MWRQNKNIFQRSVKPKAKRKMTENTREKKFKIIIKLEQFGRGLYTKGSVTNKKTVTEEFLRTQKLFP